MSFLPPIFAVLIPEDMWQRKPTFWHILQSEYYKPALITYKKLAKILTTKNTGCSKTDLRKNISQKFVKLYMINTIISLSQNKKIENRKQFITKKLIKMIRHMITSHYKQSNSISTSLFHISERFIFCLLHRTSERF